MFSMSRSVLVRQVLLPDQLEIGPLRVGVGEDDPGVELLAVLGHRAGGATPLDADVVDLLVGADVDAEPLRHPLQRLGEAPHRPPQVGPLAALAGGHPHGVVELDVTRAGVARTAEGADQPQGGGGPLHDVRLEVVLGGVGDRAQDHELQHVLVARLGELGGELGKGGRVAQDVLVHDLAGAVDHGVVDGIGLGVLLREAGDLLDRVVHALPEEETVLTVESRGEGARVALEHLHAVVEQVEIAEHLLRRQGEDVRPGGGDVPRRALDLLGEGGAADVLVALQNADVVARPGQVAGGDEPVVPAADDHRIVGIARNSHLVRQLDSPHRGRAGGKTLSGRRYATRRDGTSSIAWEVRHPKRTVCARTDTVGRGIGIGCQAFRAGCR